jgi:hypothetical protein
MRPSIIRNGKLSRADMRKDRLGFLIFSELMKFSVIVL